MKIAFIKGRLLPLPSLVLTIRELISTILIHGVCSMAHPVICQIPSPAQGRKEYKVTVPLGVQEWWGEQTTQDRAKGSSDLVSLQLEVRSCLAEEMKNKWKRVLVEVVQGGQMTLSWCQEGAWERTGTIWMITSILSKKRGNLGDYCSISAFVFSCPTTLQLNCLPK